MRDDFMRFAVQRYGTWEWLDLEAPLVSSDGPEWVRDAYGIMRAHIPAPAAHRITAPDGRPVYEEWGTFIHCEIGRRRVWSGIVKTAEITSRGWELTIVEHPGYLHGIPYEGLIRGIDDDPAVLIRQLVTDVQALPSSWYGCTVTGSTPVRVGTDLDDRVAAARAVVDARQQQLDAHSQSRTEQNRALAAADATLADEVAQAEAALGQARQQVTQLIASGSPAAQISVARDAVAARVGVYEQARAAHAAEVAAGAQALRQAQHTREQAQAAKTAADDALKALKAERSERGGAYEIRGEDLPDAYRALGDLARTAGIEWTTWTRPSDGPPDVGIEIHYPRAGRRRDDLIFDTAVNIVHALELDSEEYANVAIGVGAGEGAAAVRATVGAQTQRMRRPVVVEDKAMRTPAQLRAVLTARLRLTSGQPYVSEIEVRDHSNCPIGSWRLGDIITISGTTAAGGTYTGLARIESWSWPSRYRAKLRLTPA